MRAEEADREWPRLPRRGEVRAILAILLPEEAMAGAGKGVRLEAFPKCTHGGLGGRNGHTDSGILTAVEAQHRNLDLRKEAVGGRRAVIHDRGPEPRRAHDGVHERGTAPPA